MKYAINRLKIKIYTKSGDSGETSLFGGQRVSKDNLRIETYGTIDELNAVLGLALTEISDEELADVLVSLQNDLFVVGADLATPISNNGKDSYITRIDNSFSERLEKLIDKYSDILPELRAFILPGGSKGAAWLHLARTVCRRAERKVVTLSSNVEIGSALVVYLNRLSDLLFVLARQANAVKNSPDIEWHK